MTSSADWRGSLLEGPLLEARARNADRSQLWIDHPAFPMPGHRFTGYYFTYPSEAQHRGLVSTIADDPPMLNWIFVDKDTGLLRHGGRQDTLGGHTIGPWYWSDDEQWLTLEGEASRFAAVQMENDKWAVVFRKRRDGDREREGGDGAESETESETEGREDPGGGGDSASRRPPRQVPVMLHRKMQFGMESRYVKGEKG